MNKRLASAFLLVLFFGFQVFGADIYVAQNDQGIHDGSNPANAHGFTWFNNGGNDWTVGSIISPGDTIHWVGLLTNNMTIRGSGTAGNPITFFWEPGASLQQPGAIGTTFLNFSSRSYLTFDGGPGFGSIWVTNSGTGLGNTGSAPAGLYASGTPLPHDIEIKRLTFRDFYIHTSVSDGAANPFTSVGGVYMNGFSNNIAIHDSHFTNICWCILLGAGNGTGLSISNCTFDNYDHGVAGVGSLPAGAFSGVTINNNHFGSTSNWDTTANNWHHDGIHIFFNNPSTISNVVIAVNQFFGDWGANNTAHLFVEGDQLHVNNDSSLNFKIYNNLFLQWPNNYLNDGFLAGHGPNWQIYNNSFVGSGVNNSGGVTLPYTNINLIFTNNLLSGVGTYFALTESGPVHFNNNLYAARATSGNPPFSFNGTGEATFGAWQAAISSDANSTFTASTVVNSDGSLPIGSLAIGTAATLSTIFTVDYLGATRTVPWDIGALKFGSVPPPPVNRLMRVTNLHVSRSYTGP